MIHWTVNFLHSILLPFIQHITRNLVSCALHQTTPTQLSVLHEMHIEKVNRCLSTWYHTNPSTHHEWAFYSIWNAAVSPKCHHFLAFYISCGTRMQIIMLVLLFIFFKHNNELSFWTAINCSFTLSTVRLISQLGSF